MKLNATGLTGVVVVGALAAGAFAAGAYLGPAKPAGHNLYHPAVAAPLHSALTLASQHPGVVAANAGGAGERGADGDASDDFSGSGPGATFENIYLLVKRHFVDALPDDSKLAHGAAAAMVASLQDPDSRFMEPAEVTEINSESQGRYHGIGAALAVKRIAHAKIGDVRLTPNSG